MRSKHLPLLALAFLTACEIPDQSIIKDVAPERYLSANPKPTDRDFVGNNGRHEVLLAVFDTGVDYNHPLLKDNFHFDLQDGVPTGLGYDFVGEDPYPAPYIVHTGDKNPEAPAELGVTVATKQKQCLSYRLKYPELETYFDCERDLQGELASGIDHGTHVAGLMVYDDQRLGLVPFRTLLANAKYKDKQRVDVPDQNIANFQAGMEQAAKMGVRVVNLSWGGAKEQNIGPMREIIESHPGILFVGAAGNAKDHVVLSGKEYPCGLKYPNVLCVSALDETEDTGADYTSHSVTELPSVFAPGTDILSTVPVSMCGSSTDFDFNLKDSVRTDCPHNGLAKKSGTSMASPIVARLAALEILQNPTASPQQIIERLQDMGTELMWRGNKYKKLRIKRPSWYASSSGPKAKLKNSGYWEIVIGEGK